MLNYRIDYLIGTGKTAMVYLAYDRDGREVALKMPREDVQGDAEKSARFASEVKLSLQMDHPHIVQAFDGIASGPDAHLCLMYFPESSLDQIMGEDGRIAIHWSLLYATQIASALAYVHQQNIIHQDIKAANVFIRNNAAYLGDFGVAVSVNQRGPAAGSPYYMAPEVYTSNETSFASDVYSLAVLIYELLYGTRPFDGDSIDALMVAHMTSYPASLASRCPELSKSTIREIERALSKNPTERPSATELFNALQRGLNQLYQKQGRPSVFIAPPRLRSWSEEVSAEIHIIQPDPASNPASDHSPAAAVAREEAKPVVVGRHTPVKPIHTQDTQHSSEAPPKQASTEEKPASALATAQDLLKRWFGPAKKK